MYKIDSFSNRSTENKSGLLCHKSLEYLVENV